MSLLAMLESCRAELKRNNVPEPYQIVMGQRTWFDLDKELRASVSPYRSLRRYMGNVLGFNVYVDDEAPKDFITMEGTPR